MVNGERLLQIMIEDADAGSDILQFNLARLYQFGDGVDLDYEQAIYWYTRAAEQDNAEAQYELGTMHLSPQYDKQDFALAIKWYTMSAELGYAPSQCALGMMYCMGKGMPEDYAQALKWFTLAAEQGDTNSQHNLGTIYEYGEGVEIDYAQAVKWYTLAARQDEGFQDDLDRFTKNSSGEWVLKK